MADKAEKPIIVKKIKKGGHGHHGGAWKVAYADFVTAMMAFFLLLWLLNTVTQDKLVGIANYFTPTVGIKDQMGIGFEGGQGNDSKGTAQDKATNKAIVFGVPTSGTVVTDPEPKEALEEPQSEKIQIDEAKETKTLDEVKSEVERQVRASQELMELMENLQIKQVPEGLQIQIMDQNNHPMFAEGSAKLDAKAEMLVKKIATVIKLVPNFISITGHTNSKKFKSDKAYTNWELSSERANAARRTLVEGGLPPEQVAKVVGRADQEPLLAKHPEELNNNRISIILLRHSVQAYHSKSSPDAVFVDTEEQKRREEENQQNAAEAEKKRQEEEQKKVNEEQKVQEQWSPE